jgi:NAD(P)H-flavin reductase
MVGKVSFFQAQKWLSFCVALICVSLSVYEAAAKAASSGKRSSSSAGFNEMPEARRVHEQEEAAMSSQFVVITTTILGVVVIGILLLMGMRSTEKPEDVSKSLLQEYKRTVFDDSESTAAESTRSSKSVLSPVEFRPFHILEIKEVSYNTRLYRIEIPHGKALNLPVGRHISLKALIDNRIIVRAYTPTSPPNVKGYFDLLIKSYEFGQMSKYLSTLRAGDTLLVRGPLGNYKVTKNQYGGIGLIAGGSGLTPCLQLVRTILENSTVAKKESKGQHPDPTSPTEIVKDISKDLLNEAKDDSKHPNQDWVGDRTKFTLFYQNRTPSDILLHDELLAVQAKYPNRFQVHILNHF